MIKCCFLLLFLFASLFGSAQVLDTIPSFKFIELNNRKIKEHYEFDKDALKIINKHRSNKILLYGLYGVFSSFVVVVNSNSTIPLCVAGFYLLPNYNRKSLYNELLYHEQIKYKKDTLKIAIPTDTNSYKFKYANYIFEITFDEYKALGSEKQMTLFSINDTAQFLYEYLNSHKYNKKVGYIGSSSLLILSTYMFYEGSKMYVRRSENNFYIAMNLLFGIGTGLSAIGIYVWPTKKYINKMDSQKVFYNNLQQYYLTHKVNPNVAKYIKKRRDYYKPKPLFN